MDSKRRKDIDPNKNREFMVKFNNDLTEVLEISQSTMLPTKIEHFLDNPNEYPWLQAKNNTINEYKQDTSNAGKWVLFFDPDKVDKAWEEIKNLVTQGSIWHAKVTPSNEQIGKYVILVSVYDSNDFNAIQSIYDALLTAGLVKKGETIKYKSDKQTREREYGPEAYMLTSDDVRRANFITELASYIKTRNDESKNTKKPYKSLLGKLKGYSDEIKMNAARKKMDSLSGVTGVEFEHKELGALHDGRLGKIIDKYDDVLPKQVSTPGSTFKK